MYTDILTQMFEEKSGSMILCVKLTFLKCYFIALTLAEDFQEICGIDSI